MATYGYLWEICGCARSVTTIHLISLCVTFAGGPPPLASLGGGRENKKRGIGKHPALSLGALRPELDREHLGRYLDGWIGTRPRLVPIH